MHNGSHHAFILLNYVFNGYQTQSVGIDSSLKINLAMPRKTVMALMKIPGNQPIFYLWPIQKLLHLGIQNRAIPAIYGGSALYMVVMQRVG